MRPFKVRWKRFYLQVPGAVTLYLTVKIVAVLHMLLHYL